MGDTKELFGQWTPLIAQLEGAGSMGAALSHLVAQSLLQQAAVVLTRGQKEFESLRAISEQRNRTIGEMGEEIETRKKQLPSGMEHCTIQFIECPGGHSRLTATNWIDHGCPTCSLAAIIAERDGLRDALSNLIGLVNLLNANTGMPDDIREPMMTSWRYLEAKAMIDAPRAADDADLGSLNLQDDHTDPKSAYADAVGISRTKEL
jgi:hypothetical protein